MSEIVLPAGTEYVSVEEVPGLLALAIYPRLPAGRVVSYVAKQVVAKHGQAHGPIPIDESDMTALNGIWQGLPAMNLGILEADWPRYAEAFTNAETKPEWEPLPVWRNDAGNADILRADAEEDHRRALDMAVSSGEVIAVNHARLRVPLAFPSAIVMIDALRAYAARIGIVVRLTEPASAIAEPVTAVVESESTPLPLPTGEVADAFDGIAGKTSTQWRNTLGDAQNHQWVLPARAVQGTAPTASTWWPLKFARLLQDRGATVESLNRVFLAAPKLKPWLHHWQEATRERNAFGQ